MRLVECCGNEHATVYCSECGKQLREPLSPEELSLRLDELESLAEWMRPFQDMMNKHVIAIQGMATRIEKVERRQSACFEERKAYNEVYEIMREFGAVLSKVAQLK
jgi:antirestriction protein